MSYMCAKRKISLEEYAPDLAKQWHPTKNGDLKPMDVTYGSKKKVWWYLPYDDPKTKKHFDFEWPAEIVSRVNGSGCPYLYGAKVWPGFNDLQTKYPELAKQWHPTKNGDLKPSDIFYGSKTEVWWYFPYDDPNTGKHFDFEWPASVCGRVQNRGCPYLSGVKVWPGFNDLQTKYPELARQWHPTKNGKLKPTDITCGNDKKIWWYLPYDDPNTGKHFNFEWLAKVCDRTHGSGCPYLSGKKVWVGFNDLQTKHPELAKQWHPTKNGKLKPTDVVSSYKKEVWWYFPYNDLNTGKHFDFEWSASVWNRVQSSGCPFLSGNRAWPGFNDLQTLHPDIAKQWHPTKNGKLKPTDVTSKCSEKVWWYLPYDDPKTGKHFNFEWQARVYERTNGSGCPYLSGKKVWVGFNDLQTKYPELAKQWHPTKNGKLKPKDIAPNHNKPVWWYLSYYDPETKKHFDFEWKAPPNNRVRGDGCPYLSNHMVWTGFNDLQTKCPELAKQWHPTKNGKLKPTDVMSTTNTRVWWYFPYDDSKTGKHFNFEWQAKVCERTRGNGCPYLSNKKIWKGFNDLQTRYPELAKQWHPTKNGKLKPTDVMSTTNTRVWWLFPYDDPKTGKHFDFEWEAPVVHRVTRQPVCPYLLNKEIMEGYNDFKSQQPKFAEEWNYEKNYEQPENIFYNTQRKYWWKCKNGHSWYDSPYKRIKYGKQCPECRKLGLV